MSQYFRARRKRGACYGTLWKQHSSTSNPPTAINTLYSFDENHDDDEEEKYNSPSSSSLKRNGHSSSNTSISSSGGGGGGKGSNSRDDIRYDSYMNAIIGASSPMNGSSSSKTNHMGVDVLKAALEKNERARCYEFCVLIGNTLTGYENLTAFRRGDHPSSEIRIVGASAWNPAQYDPSSPSSSGSNAVPTFRLLTHAGTHIYCSAQTKSDRDIWLSALHSGLEITYAGFNDTLTTLSTLYSKSFSETCPSNDNQEEEGKQNETSTSPKNIQIYSSSKVLEPSILTPPIPKRYKAQLQKFVKRITISSTSSILSPSAGTSYTNNNESNNVNPFLNPYNTSTAQLSKTHCISCGRYPPEDIVKPYTGTPLTQYGLENVVGNVCHPCLIGQGLLRHVMSITALYVSDAHERVALMKGLEMMQFVLGNIEESEIKKDENDIVSEGDSDKDKNDENDGSVNSNKEKDDFELFGQDETKEDREIKSCDDNNSSSSNSSDCSSSKSITSKNSEVDEMKTLNEKKAKLDKEIRNLLHDPIFAAARHRSRTLDHISNQLSTREINTVEFIHKLNEYAHDAIGNGGDGDDCDDNNGSTNETIKMKKEALMHAGDMRAAIEMLREHALPKQSTGLRYGVGIAAAKGGTEMLSCVLEFLIDLCEQGEIASVAFFWTQICQIHMQMLPPTDTESLIRIELMEDFLLTVCTGFSVHLGLELVWSCLADLEECVGAGNMPSASCRRRRFAMIRFICELESLIFDEEGGWGGGSVCLRGMLAPSAHQESVINDTIKILQLHRRFSTYHLTRSVRLDKLRHEAQEKVSGKRPKMDMKESVMDAAQRKYQIARNAEYFSTQLMFCRRLGDIAERLFFMESSERKAALKGDLEMLNASGRLGGDPLNRICDTSTGLVNVMYIPSNEGHVFQSKERTPVLLLMEIISDQNIFESTPNSPKKELNEEEPFISNQHSTSRRKSIMNGSDLVSTLLSSESESNIEGGCMKVGQEFESDVCENENLEESDLLGLHEASVDGNFGVAMYEYPPSPKQGVLQSPKVSINRETETKEVGSMVANMIQEQLKLVSFPDLASGESNDSFLSCKEEQSSKDESNGEEIITSSNETKDNMLLNKCTPSENDSVSALIVDANNNQNDASEDMLEVTTTEDNSLQQHGLDECEVSNTESLIDLQRRKDSLEHGSERAKNCTIVAEKSNRPYEGLEADFQVEEKELNCNESPSPPTQRIQQIQPTIVDHVSGKSSVTTRKVSAFGSITDFADGSKAYPGSIMGNLNFGANGEGRRHVLNTMFVKGMRSPNLIARGVAPAARRAVQAMDRKRAQLLMNATNRIKLKSDDDTEENIITSLNSLDISESGEFSVSAKSSEEDECIEAIRLLLVQNRVALGKLTPENAALALRKEPLDLKRHGQSEEEGVDAGQIDSRLAGCGTVSNAIFSAMKLWKDGLVNDGELLELIQKDLQFTQITLPGTENETILFEDSAFWGRFAFGERWAEKKSRIQSSSTFGAQPGWDLTGLIVKANDDLRQEAFAMQLIELSKEAFEMAGLELWIQPYRILATGRTTGIIEMVRNAMSFDSLKKRPGYNEGGLLGHFKKMAEHAADPNEALKIAKRNFVQSLAAYSLLSYFFLFKDRHNGNILLDTAGHVIHIDFGFIFGIAPGGSFSLESSVPFKLTDEMIEVMDGLGSTLFSEFVTLFCCGFLAMQAHTETFVTIVRITCEGSTFKCFEGKDIPEIIFKLRERFCPNLNKEATIAHAMELIRQATNALGTKQYDFFQYLSQGIAA